MQNIRFMRLEGLTPVALSTINTTRLEHDQLLKEGLHDKLTHTEFQFAMNGGVQSSMGHRLTIDNRVILMANLVSLEGLVSDEFSLDILDKLDALINDSRYTHMLYGEVALRSKT